MAWGEMMINRFRNRMRTCVTALLGALAFALPAMAVTVNFDGTPSPAFYLTADYFESGVKMSLINGPGGGHYDFFEGTVGLHPNRDFAGSSNFSTLKFEMADGSPFDLLSLDLEAPPLSFRDGVELSVEYRFDFSNGFSLTVPADFAGDITFSWAKDLQYFTFTETVYSSLSGYAGNYVAYLDNIAIAPVPEPSTYALMLAGLAAVGFVARRRKGLLRTYS